MNDELAQALRERGRMNRELSDENAGLLKKLAAMLTPKGTDEVCAVDLAMARAAELCISSRRWLVPGSHESQETLAKFFATHRIAANTAAVGVRYRAAIGLISDIGKAMTEFNDRAQKQLDEYAARESLR